MKLKIQLAVYSFLLIIFAGITPVFADTTTTIDTASSTAQLTDPAIPASPTELPSSTLFIRYQNNLVWSGPIALTSTVYHDSINNLDYPLASPTVFSALVLADQASDAFSISDAQYNQAFNNFYLACLAFPTASSTENACYNWNFVVNNAYPNVGMDSYTLHGGENIYIYFSNPWKITASTNTFSLGTTTTIQTWRYQYDNLIEPWILDGNNIIDISVPNPASTGWWDAYIVATSTQTDANGAIDYMFTATGTYQLNFHDFTKWSPLDITVNEPAVFVTSSTTTTPTENSNNSGGASGGQTIAVSGNEISDTVQKILTFLRSKQTENGAIMDLQNSDWSAMTFGANGTYANDVRTSTASLYDYLYSTVVTSTSETLNVCAEYPRHILGLLSAGTNKTDTKIIELKNKISTECFAGGIVGQNGINDDIFITIALLATDENPNSAIVQAAIQTIISDQQTNGAFTWSGWPGQDVTGAAINALKYAANFGVAIDDAIFQNAKTYLHTTQLADGGWTGFGTTSDPLTTSWALYGINALGEGQLQWTNSNQKNPWSALVATLDNNGYYISPWSSDGIDWFSTKHAVPALLGKSWPIILSPINQPSSGGSGGGTYIASQETSTSSVLTDIISTSTAPTSTETVDPVTTSTPLVMTEPTSTGQVLGISIVNTEIQTEPKKPTRAPVQIKAQTQSQPETQTENSLAPTSTQNQNDVLETNKALAQNYTDRILYSILAGIIGIIGYIIIIKIKK
jgi:hypothetical protein